MKSRIAALILVSLASVALAPAQTRDELVRKDLAELADDPVWTYNDLDAGIAEARRSGKPLFVVLRCIP